MTVKEFAAQNGIAIPVKRWFEPTFLFENRYLNWGTNLSELMSLLEQLNKWHEKNLNETSDYIPYAEYIGEQLTVPDIPDHFKFSNFKVAQKEIGDALDVQKSFNRAVGKETFRIRKTAGRKFMAEKVAEMPQDKTIVVIRSTYKPYSENAKRFNDGLKELIADPSRGFTLISDCFVPMWIALSRDADTSQLDFGGNIFTASIQYL